MLRYCLAPLRVPLQVLRIMKANPSLSTLQSVIAELCGSQARILRTTDGLFEVVFYSNQGRTGSVPLSNPISDKYL